MLRPRVIPCLLLHKGGLYKTRQFNEPEYIGDPINVVKIFNQKEVDELIVIDIDASRNNQTPDYDLISLLAGECFMPVTFVGGINSLATAQKIFDLGVEKIGINSQNLTNISITKEISDLFGKQAVIACIDAKKSRTNDYQLYSHTNQSMTNISIAEHIDDCIAAGAGEILIQSVDNDGMQQGLDLKLIKQVSSQITVPLIALGGAGNLEDIKEGILAGANAVAAGAFFSFYGKYRAVLISYPLPHELASICNSVN